MFASGADAQQLGGQPMDIGEMLTEEIVHDEATDVLLNFNWLDWRFQTMADYPDDVEAIAMEMWKGAAEYGACGIGESVATRTSRAVADAIHGATGVRADELPITPQKVVQALG